MNQVSEPGAPNVLPPAAMIGIGALLACSLLLAGIASLTGVGADVAPEPPVVATYALRFEDRPDGSVAVYRDSSETLVDVLPPGTNGFVRGVMRGMARDRRSRDIGPEMPFELHALEGGGASLSDPATGRVINLTAFGPDNLGAFVSILNAAVEADARGAD